MKKHIYTTNGVHYIVPVLVATRQGAAFVVSHYDKDKYICVCDCGKRFMRTGQHMRHAGDIVSCGDHTLAWRKEHAALSITLTPDQWVDLQQHPKPLDQWWAKER